MFRTFGVLAAASFMVLATPVSAQQLQFATFDLKADNTAQTRNIEVTAVPGTPPGTPGVTNITGYSGRDAALISSSIDYHHQYATNGTSLSNVGLVSFSFDPITELGDTVDANMFFLGVSAPAAPANINNFSLSGFTGTIVFKPVGTGTFDNLRAYTPNSVLLAVNFTNGLLTRGRNFGNGLGDTTGNPVDSDYVATEVTFFSDFLNFTGNPAYRSFSSSYDGVSSSATSFLAGLNGSFSAEALPTVSDAPVPEMATWGMMIVGFGGIGGVIRRRKRGAALRLAAA